MKTPKFQVGDAVQIRSDIAAGEGKAAIFVTSMRRYLGRPAVIKFVGESPSGTFYYKIGGNDWYWDEDFFEDPTPCGVKVDLTGLL